jgi:hypothetical protein
MKKIALEEHFWTDGFPHTGKIGADLFEPWFLRSINARLPDFSELRIAAMDEAGIDLSVLSLNSPGVQAERDHARAVSEARRANDCLAAEVAKHPTRYAGFAHLPMQEPDAAARELERCVRQLGFRGALINGHTTASISTMRGTCRSGKSSRRSPFRSTFIRSTCPLVPPCSRTIPVWPRRCGAGWRRPAAMRCVSS